MRLIFIYGLPATGKLTVARELAAGTGYKLFHNHLVLDGLLQLFEFGSQPFIELREQLWLSIFEQASRAGLPGLIFTFAPEGSVRADFVAKTIAIVEEGGGNVDFVELVCPFAELQNRIDHPSRRKYEKLVERELFEQLYASGGFQVSYLPTPRLTIDTSLYQPPETAALIARALLL